MEKGIKNLSPGRFFCPDVKNVYQQLSTKSDMNNSHKHVI